MAHMISLTASRSHIKAYDMRHDIIWLCDRVMRFQSKTHISFLAKESPVAQWLEHPTRSRRVVRSNPIWNSDFSPSRCFYFENFFFDNFLVDLKKKTVQEITYTMMAEPMKTLELY